MLAVLRAGEAEPATLAALAQLTTSQDYELPEPARREGGLWLIDPRRMMAMRAEAASAAPAQLAAPYEATPFDAHLVAPDLSTAPSAAAPFGRRGDLPCVDFEREWPTRGRALLASGMCCTFRGLRLFRRGMEHWGRLVN